MAEWFKALVSKTSRGESFSGVQISLSPQQFTRMPSNKHSSEVSVREYEGGLKAGARRREAGLGDFSAEKYA